MTNEAVNKQQLVVEILNELILPSFNCQHSQDGCGLTISPAEGNTTFSPDEVTRIYGAYRVHDIGVWVKLNAELNTPCFYIQF